VYASHLAVRTRDNFFQSLLPGGIEVVADRSALGVDLLVDGASCTPSGKGGDRPAMASSFSGTIATQSGLVDGERYELEPEDPVLERRITGSDRVRVVKQYVGAPEEA
jgi:hypothetical protein